MEELEVRERGVEMVYAIFMLKFPKHKKIKLKVRGMMII